MIFSDSKDAHLRQLGFIRLSSYRSWDYPVGPSEAAFTPVSDVRYQHQQPASDGARLYAYAWVEEPGYLLSTERHISSLRHIVAELETDEPLALQAQVEEFFRQHGGFGPAGTLPQAPPFHWRN